MVFWHDARLIEEDNFKLNIYDPGFLYGATVFTTMRVYDRSLDHPLTNWSAHCDRLIESIKAFGWKLPKWKLVRQGAEALLLHYPLLRIAVFADGREFIIGRNLPENLERLQRQGAIAWIANAPEFSRHLPAHKTGNYLGAWLALEEARKLGAKEAILVDRARNWLETSTGNLWGWKEGCWYTPALDGGILPGIVRGQLLNWLHDRNQIVKHDRWDEKLVGELEAIAYSNCAVEIIPFSKIIAPFNHLCPDPCHPALERLRSFFSRKFS